MQNWDYIPRLHKGRVSDDKHNKRTIAQHNKRMRVMNIHINSKVLYQIKPSDRGDYILESNVSTKFGGDAINYVFRGSLEDCERVRDKLIKESE